MSALNSRLSKLEAAAGVGLSSMEQFRRKVNSRSDAELLAAYRVVKAWTSGTEPPSVPDDTMALVQRLMGLMPAAD